MANLQNLIINDSGFINIPVGSSGNRENNPSLNLLRSNTTQSIIETFDGNFFTGFAKTIVKDRLTLWLDASNSECYPGQGSNSTVYNLAPFFYTGSFINFGSSTTYDSRGWWNFDQFGGIAFGIDDLSTNPAQKFQQTSEITYEIWHYPNTIQSGSRLMSTDRSDYNCLRWDNNSDRVEWAVDGTTSFAASGFTTGEWQHIVGTASATAGTSNNLKLYRNGNVQGTGSLSLRSPMGDGSARPFAVNQNVESSVDNDAGAEGRTAIVRIYGKALSEDEVRQNFEAERTRFGV